MLVAYAAVAAHNFDLAILEGGMCELEAELPAMTSSSILLDLYVLWPVFKDF